MPALVVRVCVLRPGGVVVGRERWCWAQMPSAAALVGEVARRRVRARRCGLTLRVEALPAEAASVLELAGLRDGLLPL